MKLCIHNIFTNIQDASDTEIRRLKERFIIPVPYKARKRGQSYPETRYTNMKFFNPDNMTIYTGLLHQIVKEFTITHFKDCRIKPESKDLFSMKTLPKLMSDADYSYQETAVQDAVRNGRGLLHYPTGTGKTVIMAKVINALQVNSIVIVPNTLLLNQTYKSFCKGFNSSVVGRLGDRIRKPNKITVATQQTLYSLFLREEDFFTRLQAKFDCLFIDECHHVATAPYSFKKIRGVWTKKKNTENSWLWVVSNMFSYYRFGMTATLNTKDSPVNQTALESVTGRVISSMTVKEGVKRKVLTTVKVKMILHNCKKYTRREWYFINYAGKKTLCTESLYKKKFEKGEEVSFRDISIWKTKYDKEGNVLIEGAYENNIINSKFRQNKVKEIVAILTAEKRKPLVVVDLVKLQGELFHKMIPNSFLATGKTPKKERVTIVEDFAKTEGSTLIGTIFKEGFDLPLIDSIVNTMGGLSEKKLIQLIGRLLRVSPNKKEPVLYDFYDKDNSVCEKHSKARLKTYKEQGYEVEII